MSSVLLDTHAYLWFVYDDSRLSKKADKIISNDNVKKYLSIASLWEIAVKQQIGKLELGMDFEKFLHDFVLTREIDILAIDPSHLVAYASLPLLHRDPFDRLLIAQAQVEDLPIITTDKRFLPYEVMVTW